MLREPRTLPTGGNNEILNKEINKMSKISKYIFLLIAFVSLQITSLSIGEQAKEPNYVGSFSKGLNQLYKFRNPYGGLGKINPSDKKPQVDPNYTAFLVDVLMNGPNWLPESQHHLVRCYAAICLGMTKDPQAIEPLIKAMNTLDESSGREYYISGYAATALGLLGDSNAVEPLIAALRSEKVHISRRVPLALTWIGDLRAVGPMIEMLKEKRHKWRQAYEQLEKLPDSSEDVNTRQTIFKAQSAEIEAGLAVLGHDELLTRLTKTKLRNKHKNISHWTEEQLTDNRRQDANSLPELWSRWWHGGSQFTGQRFEAKHNEWKVMKKENHLEKSNAKRRLSEMTDLGIPAIPFMIEKVEQGETDFIPLISRLTNKELSETATQQECLEWWNKNNQKWLIPFSEGN